MALLLRETLGSADEEDRVHESKPFPTAARQVRALRDAAGAQWERLLYHYYNWRRDTSSDLLVILIINSMFIIFGALAKYALVDPFLVGTASDPVAKAEEATGLAAGIDDDVPLWARIWPDIYDVTLLTFGENFPADNESWLLQLYSVAMGLLGVISFALVLALTERIILEVIESNVQQGTKVFEKGHVVVLAHAVAGKDMECIWRILNQTIWAYRATGGTTIVVLCNREKVTLERVYRAAIPDTKGSTIVFRQGNPLLPSDLKEVGCPSADSIIVVSDPSREANEADAQSVRTCILIDELVQASEALADARGVAAPPAPHVVVELLNYENCNALQFVTDIDVHMVLTRNLNAKRLARMVLAPVLAGVSSMLFDFRSSSQQFTQSFPELKGRLFKDVPFLFDEATVVGLFPANERDALVINPAPGYVMQVKADLSRRRPMLSTWKPPCLQDLVGEGYKRSNPDDASPLSSGSYPAEDSNGSSADQMRERGAILVSESRQRNSKDGSSDEEATNGASVSSRDARRADSTPASQRNGTSASDAAPQRYYKLPNEYVQSRSDNEPVKVLVVGWGEQSFMEALLFELDKGDQSLPVSSEIVFLHTHGYDTTVGKALERVGVTCLHVSHVRGNPLAARTYKHTIDISGFACAMCLCDNVWIDPDADSRNGIDFMEQRDMLRLDSMLLLVQLNIRNALKAKNLQDINIICEKLAIAGNTRFEDRFRLPLGISVNMTSYAAKLLVQTTFDPAYGIRLLTSFGRYVNVTVLDSGIICNEGERLSWWELVARAQTCRLVLFAYYDIPSSLDIPVKLHSNPLFDRSKQRVWNDGSKRRKLICLENRAPVDSATEAVDEVSTSDDTIDVRWKLLADGNVTMLEVPPGLEHVDEDLDVQVVDLNDGSSVRKVLAEEGVAIPATPGNHHLDRPQGLRTHVEAECDESDDEHATRASPARTPAQAAVEQLLSAGEQNAAVSASRMRDDVAPAAGTSVDEDQDEEEEEDDEDDDGTFSGGYFAPGLDYYYIPRAKPKVKKAAKGERKKARGGDSSPAKVEHGNGEAAGAANGAAPRPVVGAEATDESSAPAAAAAERPASMQNPNLPTWSGTQSTSFNGNRSDLQAQASDSEYEELSDEDDAAVDYFVPGLDYIRMPRSKPRRRVRKAPESTTQSRSEAPHVLNEAAESTSAPPMEQHGDAAVAPAGNGISTASSSSKPGNGAVPHVGQGEAASQPTAQGRGSPAAREQPGTELQSDANQVPPASGGVPASAEDAGRVGSTNYFRDVRAAPRDPLDSSLASQWFLRDDGEDQLQWGTAASPAGQASDEHGDGSCAPEPQGEPSAAALCLTNSAAGIGDVGPPEGVAFPAVVEQRRRSP